MRRAGVDYRESVDTVRGFVKERCRLKGSAWVRGERLYDSYRLWCETSGGQYPLGKYKFYSKLQSAFPGKIHKQTQQKKRGFSGIKLVFKTPEA